MGVVYKARQVSLNRTVALKMILAGSHAGAGELARFKAEAEVIARLQHPNVVQIHEIGDHLGLPFFSLEFCAGGSLACRLKGVTLTPAEAATLVETLAGAVAAAHRAGVIHRDLKPANVLLTADGLPKITDFGLAKQVGEVGLTASGAIMGTPSYMAPEQARGDVKAVGPAADVYALGAILYEVLTRRPPFQGTSIFDTIMHVLEQDPVAPSRLRPRVPRDLETICLKCLAKDPAKRYASAADLADDLARFRAGEPIKGRPIGRLGRWWRRIRRNPLMACLGLVVMGLLAGIVLLAKGPVPPPADPRISATLFPDAGDDELLQVVAELNRTDPGWRLEHLEATRKAVPPARNSAFRLTAAKNLLPADWEKQLREYAKSFGSRPADELPRHDQRTALTTLRQSAAASLAEARTLAKFPEGRHAVNYARDFLNTLLPHGQDTRAVVELLSLDALGQALDGHPDEATVDCRAILNASRSLNDEPAAIIQLVRIACHAIAVQATERVLRYGEAPAAEVGTLQRLLEREAEEPILRTMAQAERGGMHWAMSAVTSGDFDVGASADLLKGDPDLAKALKAIPAGQAARHAHAWLLRHLTRFVEIARLPDHQQAEAIREWDRVARTAPLGANVLLVAAPNMVDACLRDRAIMRSAVAALATERYRLMWGRWPERLSDLAPDLLKEVPADPYDGRPLRYT